MRHIRFSSYAKLSEHLKLKYHPSKEINGLDDEGIESIKLIDHPNSYNYIVPGYNKIYVVGKGRRSGPGYPSAHHSELNQHIVWNTYRNNKDIHVILETLNGHIKYLGKYFINNIRRRITDSGWVYCEMELIIRK
jgi:hypothetical protein